MTQRTNHDDVRTENRKVYASMKFSRKRLGHRMNYRMNPNTFSPSNSI